MVDTVIVTKICEKDLKKINVEFATLPLTMGSEQNVYP